MGILITGFRLYIAVHLRQFQVALLMAMLMLASTVSAQPVTLVKDGLNAIPIVVPADAAPMTYAAADELAHYVEMISGARPEVIKGVPSPIPAHAIWVGYQPVLDTLFSGVNFKFANAEEILLAANGKHVVIAGRDRWLPDALNVDGTRGTIESRQQEYGSANAVYTFLRDKLGVRWFWPGALGTDVTPSKTITIEAFEYRYHPQFRARQNLFIFARRGGRSPVGAPEDWVRLQRVQLDSLDSYPQHAFSSWWSRFSKDHPDYFALQPDGTRSLFPRSARAAKLCYSNPAVLEQWFETNVLEELKRDPSLQAFNASTNDGWNAGHCICENCRAWDDPDGESRSFTWAGFTQDYVALSDREVTFANLCGRLLKKRFPDKDYYVSIMAYGHTRPAPIKARPDDNVIITSVANFLGRTGEVDRGSSRGDTFRQQYDSWTKVTSNLIWRPNTSSPAGWQQGMLDVSIEQSIKDYKYVASTGAIGLCIDSVWEHWATQGPMYYVIAHLAWDPSIDAHALLADYYHRAFGPAAGQLAQYWQDVDAKREQLVSQETKDYAGVYDQAFFDKANGYFDQAESLVADGPQVYRDRVDFMRRGLVHQQLMVDLHTMMATYRSADVKDEKLAQAARDKWKLMEENATKYEFALNPSRLKPKSQRTSYLHPDHVK